ncbi:MAG: hypothetical protein KKF74_02860 [Nanoarchaeota archaeon]|nr:hypothetical protein [Nanoarchaeota archaeon]
MGFIRFGFKLLKYFAIFSIGYYMGGGCENTTINQEIKKETSYIKPAYYQTVDKKVMRDITQFSGLEKSLTLYYPKDKK